MVVLLLSPFVCALFYTLGEGRIRLVAVVCQFIYFLVSLRSFFLPSPGSRCVVCAALNKWRRAMRCGEAKRQTKALRVVRKKVSSSPSFDTLLRRLEPTTSTQDRKDNQILCESKRFPIFVFFFIFFILAKHSKRFSFIRSFYSVFSVSP